MGRGIERTKISPTEGKCGESPEFDLSVGGEEDGVFWGWRCRLFGGDDFIGQPIGRF
jgi:hypothetical protein